MLSFVNNMVIRMVSNGCFILLAAISLLAMPSKADVWTRIAEKIAKEQNPGAGSKAGIATRLEKLSEIEEFGLWKIEQRKRDLSDSSQKLHVPPIIVARTIVQTPGMLRKMTRMLRMLGKICIGVIVGVGALSALIGGLFRGMCMFFAHKKDDEMKEEK